MKNSLITIAIASYNNASYIERCVDSVIAQTYHNLEILIVDDGSQDDTISVLEKYKTDNRIKIVCKENGGLSSVRQMALEIATGDYICFIDADDYLSENYVESMLLKMTADNSNVCVCSTKFVNEAGEQLDKETKMFLCKDSKHPINVTPQKIADITNPEIKQLHLSDSWNKMYSMAFIRSTGVQFCMPKGLNGSDSLFNRLLILHSPKYSTVENAGYIHVIYKSSAVHRKNKDLFSSFAFITEKLKSEADKLNYALEETQWLTVYYYGCLFRVYNDVYKESVNLKNDFNSIYRKHSTFINIIHLSPIKIKQIDSLPRQVFVFLFRNCHYLLPIYIMIYNKLSYA